MLPQEINTLAFGPSVSAQLGLVDDDHYYQSVRNKPITKDEIRKVVEDYCNLIVVCQTHVIDVDDYESGEGCIRRFCYVPSIDAEHGFDPITTYELTSEYILPENMEECESNLESCTPRISVSTEFVCRWTSEDRSTSEECQFEAPDILLVHEVYTRRGSLMRINPNYAREKTREYFDLCVNFFSTRSVVKDLLDYQLFLYLISQCIALRIKYKRGVVGGPFDEVKELNEKMLVSINTYIDNKM